MPAYNEFARTVIMPALDQDALAEIMRLEAEGDTQNPRYEELLMAHHYVRHVLRMPAEEWPEPVTRSFGHVNNDIYVPTLVIGGGYDTMDPAHLREMADKFPKGRYLHCPEGSHLAMYDDQETYFAGLIDFLREVEQGTAVQ